VEDDVMRRISRFYAVLAVSVWLAALAPCLAGEDLGQAWNIALHVNQQLQSQQSQSVAAGLNLKAAKSDRLPTVRNYTINSFLTTTPEISTKSFFGNAATGGPAGGVAGIPGQPGLGFGGVPLASTAVMTGLPSAVPVLGPGQRDLPVSLTFATLPLYTGGRLLRNIDAAGARLGAQRSEEFRTVLDLKLTVAEAYIAVLRTQKNLEVARSNVEQLASFARDVRNRRKQGLAIRNEELAAQVSLANARLTEIQAVTSLQSAWATYNRYLCRPLTEEAHLDELTVLPSANDWKNLAEQSASDDIDLPVPNDENEVHELTERAFRGRPELAGLAEQARGLRAQAESTRSGVRPQAGFIMSFAYIGNNNQIPQGIGAATFYLDWTITDGGATRRRAAALNEQEIAAIKRRNDTAADVALQVRTRWLDLQQARRRVPVARLAIAQAGENITVVTERYRQQLSVYTEVLDAETRRVQALNNFYNSIYDESLALFRLRRAVGDL
jgi:outer membrane protein